MEQDKDYCHHEDTLLRDDTELTKAAKNTEKTQNSSDSLTAMIINMNQTMAGNISSTGNALKRMYADTDHGGNISSMGNALKRMRADTESLSNV